jgi:hypothetical protein
MNRSEWVGLVPPEWSPGAAGGLGSLRRPGGVEAWSPELRRRLDAVLLAVKLDGIEERLPRCLMYALANLTDEQRADVLERLVLVELWTRALLWRH